MKHKMILMKIAVTALVGLAVVASPAAWADGKKKQKSESSATKSGKPSMEETMGFVRDKLTGCGRFVQLKSAEGAPWYSTEAYTWNNVSFDVSNNTLSLEELIEESISLNCSNGEDCTFPNRAEQSLSGSGYTVTNHRRAYRAKTDSASVNLGDLSPEVKVVSERKVGVELMCSSGSCFKNSTGSASNTWTLEICGDKSEAERLAKAMTHAITLAGGKKPVF